MRRPLPDLTSRPGFDLIVPGRDAALVDEAITAERDADDVVAFLGLSAEGDA